MFIVNTLCNQGKSFLCGGSYCIPKELVCDGVTDCPGGIDEADCYQPKSCMEWWNAGYKENGFFKIGIVQILKYMFLFSNQPLKISVIQSHFATYMGTLNV